MQPVRVFARNALPWLYDIYKRRRRDQVKERLSSMEPLGEDRFRSIITEDLGVCRGDTVFFHSSFSRMGLGFPPERVIDILLDAVGDEGTISVPTYPPMNSTDYLRSGQVFDVRNTPSRTGVLTELVRTRPGAVRSLHPTKSVSAIGRNAEYLVRDHHRSPYPYDRCSPYYRIIELDGKYLGLGVNSYYIASLHCVDDIMKEDYPVHPYYRRTFKARCIDREGKERTVETYSHPLYMTDYDMHRFVQRHIDRSICSDHLIEGREFFTARMKPLFERAMELARRNITIYPRSSYRLAYMFRRG